MGGGWGWAIVRRIKEKLFSFYSTFRIESDPGINVSNLLERDYIQIKPRQFCYQKMVEITVI